MVEKNIFCNECGEQISNEIECIKDAYELEKNSETRIFCEDCKKEYDEETNVLETALKNSCKKNGLKFGGTNIPQVIATIKKGEKTNGNKN